VKGMGINLKILFINKYLYPHGGSESYILKVGNYLLSQGHKVEYFGMEDERNIVGNHACSYTSNMDFHKNSFSIITYPFRIIYSFDAKKKIRNVLNDFRPDVVSLNNFNYQITPSIIDEIKKDKIPIIYTAHDYQLVCPNHMLYDMQSKSECRKCLKGNFLNCFLNMCIHDSSLKSFLGSLEAVCHNTILHTYKKIDQIICPSYFMEDKFSNSKDLRGKTIVLHNFTDSADMKSERKEDYVLYFGRYSEEKGIKTLISVCKELSHIKFIFAGEGPLESLLDGISNITNAGFQSKIELVDLIKKARFTVCPSECIENCPFSVLESQRFGTPVIGANIGGIPELIEDRKTGLLFKPGNTLDLKNKILTLWNNPDFCNELSKHCMKTNIDTVESYCKKLLNIYETCLITNRNLSKAGASIPQ
jgi:glycosyltransferase involved in cell wall biosynthesis